ncbi:2278_t:CDS:2, partial [Gigaspora margarita]
GSKDGGVDIYVNIYGIKFVVQYKNWIKEIGPSVIQSLDRTLTQQPKGTIGVVVVPDNGDFTFRCKERSKISVYPIILTKQSQLWSESSQQIKDKYRQLAKDIKLEYQKRNSGKKYTYKKQSAVNSYKRKRLDTNHENNGELTEKVNQILNFHLNNSISKESNEINNCKEAYSKDSNNDQKDYSEETKEVLFDYQQPGFAEYDIFDLNSSQFPLEGYFNGWQSAESVENPSALIYEEQLIDKSENGKSTENLIDNSVLNGLQTTKNIENSESSKKVSNLDLAALMRLIT